MDNYLDYNLDRRTFIVQYNNEAHHIVVDCPVIVTLQST